MWRNRDWDSRTKKLGALPSRFQEKELDDIGEENPAHPSPSVIM